MTHNRRRGSSNSERLRSGSYSSGSHFSTPDKKKNYSVKKDGYRALLEIAQELKRKNNGNILWNDIRNLYRKDTGRHLNSEELNLICGTQMKTKNELMHGKLSFMFVPLDEKAHVVRLRSLTSADPPTMNPNLPNPARVETEEKRRLSDEEKMEKRKAITENLLRSGLLMSDSSVPNSSKSVFSQSSECTCDQVANESSLPLEEDVFDDPPPVTENSKVVEGGQEEDPKAAEGVEEDLLYEDKVEGGTFDAWVARTRTFSQDDNSDETEEKFERSVLKRLNSLGSIDGEENAISAVSSTMNAAFIASDSQFISFDSVPEDADTNGKDQLSPSPLSDPDISLHFSTSPVNGRKPETPSITREMAMCSSRNENDESTAMPLIDVSPVNKGEENDIYEVRYRPVVSTQAADSVSIEDRVPHLSLPRGSHLRDFAKGDCVSHDASGQSLTSRGDANLTTEEKFFQTEADGNLKVSTGDQNYGNTVTTALNNEPPVIPPLSNLPAGDHADTDDDIDNISYDDESVKSDDVHNHDSHESEAMVLPNTDTAVSTATVQLEINDDFQDQSVSGNIDAEEESGVVKLAGDFLRKPLDTRERQNTSLSTIPEDRETLASVSPMKEPDHPYVDGNNIVPADAAPEASEPKEERSVRVRVPRRRWLDCCTIF